MIHLSSETSDLICYQVQHEVLCAGPSRASDLAMSSCHDGLFWCWK